MLAGRHHVTPPSTAGATRSGVGAWAASSEGKGASCVAAALSTYLSWK